MIVRPQLEAKAVLERDLEALRASRSKLENEATAGRTSHTNEETKQQPLQSEQRAHDDVTMAPEKSTEAQDVSMIDRPVKAEMIEQAEQPRKTDFDISTKAEPFSLKEEQDLEPPPQGQPPPTTSPQAPISATGPGNLSRAAEGSVPDKDSKAPLSEEQPLSASIRDVNFESMFDDTAGGGNESDIDFDLGFPKYTANAQALIDDNPFGTETSNVDVSNMPAATTEEDIDSLLPGLESFANAADDFAMMEMPPASTSAEDGTATTRTTLPATSTADVPPDLLPPESNFDDMFFDSADFTMDDGNGGGHDGDEAFGEIGDFDDSWFKTDGL